MGNQPFRMYNQAFRRGNQLLRKDNQLLRMHNQVFRRADQPVRRGVQVQFVIFQCFIAPLKKSVSDEEYGCRPGFNDILIMKNYFFGGITEGGEPPIHI